jgi:hypothetical protein
MTDLSMVKATMVRMEAKLTHLSKVKAIMARIEA